MSEKIRIQKFLSLEGLLSRRKAEEYLVKGWIKLNGQVVKELGTKIDPEKDKVELSPDIESIRQKYIYLVFNKPRGVVTNCSQKGEKEISDLLPSKYKHLNAIGRLDKDSEGLILLTDDGVYTKQMLNSAQPHEREYLVRIDKELTKEMKEQLENGIFIQGKKTLPTKIEMISQKYFKMTMIEGKNRQIRRMLSTLKANVVKLKRIRFANISLGKLEKGQYRILSYSQSKTTSSSLTLI